MWQYIKTHKLQDSEKREFINCNSHLRAVCVLLTFFFIQYNLSNLDIRLFTRSFFGFTS